MLEKYPLAKQYIKSKTAIYYAKGHLSKLARKKTG